MAGVPAAGAKAAMTAAVAVEVGLEAGLVEVGLVEVELGVARAVAV